MNVDWISRLPGNVRILAYFGMQRLIGSRVGDAWRDFQQWTRLTPSELKNAVDLRLGRALDNAVVHSEHYRRLGVKRGLSEAATSFLTRFPILSRDDLRNNFSKIVADPLRSVATGPQSISRKKYDWLVVKTGGTTGTPTAVIHDAWFRDCGRATRLFSQKLCGFPLGTRYFRLWGSEQDLMQSTEKLDRRILRNLLGEIPLNAFRAKQSELAHHIITLNAHNDVKHMMAYVDAAASLAMFAAENNLSPPSIKTIMACAGTVTQEWRTILQQVFHATVFDKYGSRECADIACECHAHSGLHIYSPNVFVEVVDGTGRPSSPGTMGRVLVTLLNNHSFPMIRYEIGDVAVPADETAPCLCGLSFPRLANIQGRADDMLTTESRTLLSSVFVRHIVGVSLNRELIQEWQLVQTGALEFEFRFVPRQSEGLTENLEVLRQCLKRAVGQSCRITLREVGSIAPSATGKIRWIVNQYHP